MWIENQNTQTKVYIGIAISNLIYTFAISNLFSEKLVLPALLIGLVIVILLGLLIRWLSNNNYSILSWIRVLLPLLFINHNIKQICMLCKTGMYGM